MLDDQLMKKITEIVIVCVLFAAVFGFDTGFPLIPQVQPGQGNLATKAFSTNQNAGTYTVFTATTQDVMVEYCTFYVTVSATGLTTLTVQTDDTTSIPMLASVAVAALTGGKNLTVFTSQTYIPVGKHIQASIVGTNGTGGSITVTCKYTPVVLGGLLL
jgi:hypothetical protein